MDAIKWFLNILPSTAIKFEHDIKVWLELIVFGR